jgi:hypothetical protein
MSRLTSIEIKKEVAKMLELENKKWLEFEYYFGDKLHALKFLTKLVKEPDKLGCADWIDFGTEVRLGGKRNSQSAYASVPYLVNYAKQCELNDNNRLIALSLVSDIEFLRQKTNIDVIDSLIEKDYFNSLRIGEKLVLESININCWSGKDLLSWFISLGIFRGKYSIAVFHPAILQEDLACKECGSYFDFDLYSDKPKT